MDRGVKENTSRLNWRCLKFSSFRQVEVLRLPSEVSEGLVRIRHAVGVFPLGDRCAFLAVGCHEFISEFGSRSSAFLFADGAKNPAES